MMQSLETDVSCVVLMSRFFMKYTYRLAFGSRHLDGKVLMSVGDVSHLDLGLAMTQTTFCMCL